MILLKCNIARVNAYPLDEKCNIARGNAYPLDDFY
jgi:hypothetical protein